MDLALLLSQKGFMEGTDFSYINGELLALDQTRVLIEEIHHPELTEVLDAEGNIVQTARAAYTEVIETDEIFQASLPSLQELKLELVKAADPAMLISKYLEGKDRSEDDSFNIDLFLAGGPGWRFENIPAPSLDELIELIPVVQNKQTQDAINAEAQAFLSSTDWLIIRESEGGAVCSSEIKVERAAARARIVR